jgi:subtilisin family serine protease
MSQRSEGQGGRPPRLRRPLAVLAAAVLGVTALPAVATAAPPHAAVSPQLLTELKAKSSTSFMVYLRERATLDATGKLDGTARPRDSGARATAAYQQLTGTAQRTQAGLRAALDAKKARYTPFWIANAVQVQGDKALLDAIAARPEVERIDPVHTYKLIKPAPAKTGAKTTAAGPEWGLTNIEAPRVWSELGDRGEGIVVASIDSGVQYDHPAVVRQYRGNLGNGTFDHNYNWYDPANVCPTAAPCDNNDHGTHTMGTMVGDDGAGNQVGVAPGAKWIAAKGCETDDCSETSLLAAGQWVLAPTDLNGQNPRPDLHPDIVNNSWGGGQNDPFYRQLIAAWRAAGIFPSFAAGNDGPYCGTANSPGDGPGAYATGSYDVNNEIAYYSSRGASSVDGSVKPNISAPGEEVRSSVPGGGYAAFSGTSMAAPHVSGTVALIWSAAPGLRGDIASTETLLDDSATDVDALDCGGTIDDNNTFGEGRLNAYQAVSTAPRGPAGRVSGAVTDAAGGPLADATIAFDGRRVLTGPDGRYALALTAGEHQLTATAYGYASQTATISVPEGGAITRDFTLAAVTMATVSGKVTDGSGHNWPLYARIDVAGRPGGPVFTDPFTGRYSLTVPGNASYKLTTTAQYPGYRAATTDVAVTGTGRTSDVALRVEEQACAAPGYSVSLGQPRVSESFDGGATPAGWSVVNRTQKGTWTFNDPGKRGNLTGGTGDFAIVDSDSVGAAAQDTDLRTPALDLSGVGTPYVRFNSDWRAVGVNDSANVDVSVDGGTTWTNVWHQTASLRGPRVEDVPIAPAANAPSAMVRLRFQGTYGYWWEVDDVKVLNRTCDPAPGGLVAGFTTDANTGAALNGARVSSVATPSENGVSAATPDDANLPDGFYSLFSGATGAHPFTAKKLPYQPPDRTVTVAADGVSRADLAFEAGRLSVTPAATRSDQPYGSTRTTTLTVKNTGSAPADVEVLERSPTFDLLSRKGAPLIEQKAPGISRAFGAGARTGAGGNAGAGDEAGPGVKAGASGNAGGPAATEPPSAEPAWTRMPNLPADVSDNAAAALNGKVYSVGGAGDRGYDGRAWVYDPEAEVWTALPNLPSPRAKPSAAAANGKLYVIGGWGPRGVPVDTVDVFDPAVGTWSTLAGVTNPAPAAAAGTAVVDSKIYLVGGCLDHECKDSNKNVIFDLATGAFSTGTDYPFPVSWMSCGGIGTRVYCAGGGAYVDYADVTHKDGFSYNTATGRWSPIPDLPLDLWGSEYTTANGMLVINGGATGPSPTIGNRTLGYDPVAGAWLDLPNSQFASFRGAAACGVYRVGGGDASRLRGGEVERLGGLDLCRDPSDVPWISGASTPFTLAPGASRTVTVALTATAAAGVAQPGRYAAELGIASNTPYAVPVAKLEMNVAPPATWGKIQGTVLGQACNGERVAVTAAVRIKPADASGDGYAVTADSKGHYAYWVPKGKYDVVIARDGWLPDVRQQKIAGGSTSTLDFVLDPAPPCDARAGGI